LSDAGRNPTSARVLPGLAPIVGTTTAKAAELAAEIGDRVLPQTARGLMSITFSGFDFRKIDLDAAFRIFAMCYPGPPNCRSRH
jgi:alkanesulfonate monooxygenase SsuD/methylene tetrahydromethanopterin reductase-like flavin-dependent oxidoreductase (luciferase family)